MTDFGRRNRKRRVVISGSFGVGKSTTAAALSAGTGIPLVESRQMRSIVDALCSGKTLRDCSPDELYRLFLTRFIERKSAEERCEEGFISDGSALNEWAYLRSRLECGPFGPDTQVRDEGFRYAVSALEPVVKEHCRRGYDEVIYLPIEFPIPEDGYRPISDEFRQTVDRNIKEAWSQLGIPSHTVTGTCEERVEQIVDLLGLDSNSSPGGVRSEGTNVWYGRIEDALGWRQNRYFSSGFSKVRHYLYDVTVDHAKRRVTALADVSYPDVWSVKGGKKQLPHLANIDVLLMMGQLAQLLLCTHDGISREQSHTMWVRNVQILNLRRIEQLDRLPLVLQEEETQHPVLDGKRWHLGVMRGSLGDGAIKIDNYRVCYQLPDAKQDQVY